SICGPNASPADWLESRSRRVSLCMAVDRTRGTARGTSPLDLREGRRYQEAGSVLRGVVLVLGVVPQLHPPRVRSERLPAGQMRGQVRARRDVAQVRQVRSCQRLSEEDGRHAEGAHDLRLAVVEHRHLAEGRALAMALVV